MAVTRNRFAVLGEPEEQEQPSKVLLLVPAPVQPVFREVRAKEPRPAPPAPAPAPPKMYKTKLCVTWECFGTCPYQERCLFAHGDGDLRAKWRARRQHYGEAASPKTPSPASGRLRVYERSYTEDD